LGAFQLVEVEENIWVANVLVHDGTRVQVIRIVAIIVVVVVGLM
jgi:hypothetical protein